MLQIYTAAALLAHTLFTVWQH